MTWNKVDIWSCFFSHTCTKLRPHLSGEEAVHLCPPEAGNTWPGEKKRGGGRQNRGMREGAVIWPRDAEKERRTAVSPSGLCHRSGPRSHRGLQVRKTSPTEAARVRIHVGAMGVFTLRFVIKQVRVSTCGSCTRCWYGF